MLTKERVFQIMGKYYGNAYYRSAIAQGISEHDLELTTALLNKINALGYLNETIRTAETNVIPGDCHASLLTGSQ